MLQVARRIRNLPRRALIASMRSRIARRGIRLLLNVPFDPFAEAFLENPYPFYEQLRERDPIYRSPFGVWILTRYADAEFVLTDPRFVHADYKIAVREGRPPVTLRRLRSNSFLSNPPDHTRIRTAVANSFTIGSMAAMRPQIQAIVERRLASLRSMHEADAISAIARPIPIEVTAGLLGIPLDDAVRCNRWTSQMVFVNDLIPEPARLAEAESAAVNLIDYFTSFIEQCRREPRPGVLNALVHAQNADRLLNEEELVAVCVFLFAASHETVVSFLGLAIHLVLTKPELANMLRQRPEAVPGIVDEILRLAPPVQLFGREPTEPVKLRDKLIPRGEAVFIATSAVNRDPERFPDPERIDPGRREAAHLSFGRGIHMCMGQMLARMEGQMLLPRLVDQFPAMRVVAAPVWRPLVTLRAIQRLEIAW